MVESGLARSRIFDGLSPAEREHWLAQATRVSIARGQTLARQGEPARHFHLLESGLLKVLQLTEDGDEVVVRFLVPAEPFGGVVALGIAPYPVTAVAVQPSTALAWPRQLFQTLLERTPQVRVNIMRELATHMTDALTRIRELTTARVDERLAHTLLRLCEQCGQREIRGVRIMQPLTRQDLADLTGTTLYTVSRTLTKWTALGLVESDRRRLLVTSPERLEAAARAPADVAPAQRS